MSKNPFTDGSVKAGDKVVFLKRPDLALSFKFAGVGPEVVCTVDEAHRHLVGGKCDVILLRKDLVYVPKRAD